MSLVGKETRCKDAVRRSSAHDLVERYTDQPAVMPEELRLQIEKAWQGEQVQLYAMADLDARMRFSRTWIALGPQRVAVARESGGGMHGIDVSSYDRKEVQSVRHRAGLSD